MLIKIKAKQNIVNEIIENFNSVGDNIKRAQKASTKD